MPGERVLRGRMDDFVCLGANLTSHIGGGFGTLLCVVGFAAVRIHRPSRHARKLLRDTIEDHLAPCALHFGCRLQPRGVRWLSPFIANALRFVKRLDLAGPGFALSWCSPTCVLDAFAGSLVDLSRSGLEPFLDLLLARLPCCCITSVASIELWFRS